MATTDSQSYLDELLPQELTQLDNPQTAIPAIAKNPKQIEMIEEAVTQQRRRRELDAKLSIRKTQQFDQRNPWQGLDPILESVAEHLQVGSTHRARDQNRQDQVEATELLDHRIFDVVRKIANGVDLRFDVVAEDVDVGALFDLNDDDANTLSRVRTQLLDEVDAIDRMHGPRLGTKVDLEVANARNDSAS